MNSKGIKPRVGMQVFSRWVGRKRITKIEKGSLFDGNYRICGCPGNGFAWDAGMWEIEWIPPTDKERAMFREAAEQFRDDNRQSNLNESARFPSRLIAAQIAESLAMDGL